MDEIEKNRIINIIQKITLEQAIKDYNKLCAIDLNNYTFKKSIAKKISI